MAVKPASAWGSAWTASAGKATQNYNEGVQSTTADWAGNTVRQQAVMQANWLNSLATWAARVNQVGTQGWKAATVAKSANFGSGFQAGATKYNAAAAKLQPYMVNAVAALPPRGDINANLQRSNALAMALHSQKGNFKADA